jgi:hypothetical protein
MSNPRGRVVRVATAFLVVLAFACVSAPAAGAQQQEDGVLPLRTVTGGESVMHLNIQTLFNTWSTDRIGANVLPPAFIDGLTFTAHFPITGGLVERGSLLGTVNHGGGMKIVQYNANYSAVEQSFEATNLRFVNGNMMTGDILGLVPAPNADLVNTQITQGEGGVIHFEADVNLNDVSALVLNTYFDTSVFAGGQNLGHFVSNIETAPVL